MAKVLVTDDTAFMRQMLRELLEKEGHEIIEAETGTAAILAYRMYQPDVVILDITMPEMDGLTCLRKLREEFPDAKVIMCSAMGQQDKVVEAIESGAKDFIVKPAHGNRIPAAVKKVLGEM